MTSSSKDLLFSHKYYDMKGLLFSVVVTLLIMFGFYYAVSKGHLAFPFDKECLLEMGMDKDRAKVVFGKKGVKFSEMGFLETIHYYVKGAFFGLSNLTELSYKFIATLLYFLILPLIWLINLDRRTDFHWFKIGYAAIFAALYLIAKKSPAEFGNLIFDKLQALLMSSSSVISYQSLSVIVGVILPIAMFSIVNMLFQKKSTSASTY